jgi:hypothetical protein
VQSISKIIDLTSTDMNLLKNIYEIVTFALYQQRKMIIYIAQN